MQDILKKCLEMLNSDISDTETQPQPDVERDSMSSAASSNFSIDIKMETDTCSKVKTTSPPHEQGLLKIASPLPPALPDVTPPVSPPSPGPPVLEPMTSIPSSQTSISRSVTSSSAGQLLTSTSVSTVPRMTSGPPQLPITSCINTVVSAAAGPPQLGLPSLPNSAISVTAGPPQLGQQAVTNPAVSVAAGPPQLSLPTVTNPGSNQPIQQIILPPVQAGQQQQFILQPQQLAGTTSSVMTNTPTQPLLQGGQLPLVQIVQAGLPLQYNAGPIPLLNPQGQLMATVGGVTNQAQLVSNLQNFVMMIQPTLPTNNLQPGLNNPIIIKQEPNTNQLKPVGINQPPSQLVNIAPTTNNLIQPSFVNPSLATTSLVSSSPLNTSFQNTTPIKLGQSLPPSTPLISNQPNFNMVQTPSGQSFNIIQQPQMTTTPTNQQQQQPTIIQSTTPNILSTTNILQPQSNAMNILANNTNQITTTSNINLLPSTSNQSAQPANIINLPQAQTSTSTNTNNQPTVQLVQDPNTGLYNLVQQQQQQPTQSTVAVTQPQLVSQSNQPTTAPKMVVAAQPNLTESPKRSATPILAKGSPLKVPKLLLPSLPSTKENKPTPEPPVKQFMCGVCNKYFGNQKNLRVHISEIHEGKRGQFPCDICNKVFPRKRNMERHKNALHLKNHPQCYLCHKSVVNLEMHIKRFHKSSTEIKIKVEETNA